MAGQNHAIVFGAAGLLGWSVVEQVLSNYPAEGSFGTVTAVINRPLAESEFYWPEHSPSRPGLQVVPGVDLFSGTADDLSRQLKKCVPGIADVTHVFYFGMWYNELVSISFLMPFPVFKEVSSDQVLERKTNCAMIQRVVEAITTVSANLKSFVYPGGTRVSSTCYSERELSTNLPRAMASTSPVARFRLP